MKIDRSFFNSKLAQHIFLMFVACALLPIACLFILSFTEVTDQLHQQSHKRLKQAAKAHGLSIYERLLFLEEDMLLCVAAMNAENSTDIHKIPDDVFKMRLTNRFRGFFMHQPGKGYRSFYGEPENIPGPEDAHLQHIVAGNTAIITQNAPDGRHRIFLLRRINMMESQTALIIAEVNPFYLWRQDYENNLPTGVSYCILDEAGKVLFSTLSEPIASSYPAMAAMTSSKSDQFDITLTGEKHLASRWHIYLKPKFMVIGWTVVLLHSEAHALAPIASFQKMFILVVLMALWIVLLLSIRFIRRSLGPLELLKEGTRRIARTEFDCRVDVKSRDEFEELAESFNQMSSRLSRQFKTLVTKAEIDRAILSSLTTDKIVKTVITRMRECFSYDAISIGLVDSDGDDKIHLFTGTGRQGSEIRDTHVSITAAELKHLTHNPEHVFIDQGQNPPGYLLPLSGRGINSLLVLPVFLKSKLAAILAFGPFVPEAQGEEELQLARQIADQVAVALSNSELMEELKQLNWGALKALARAVDAKSPWTAGHSERVTQLALQIGKALDLDAKALDNLHRAALLHDIGKLGIPAPVLDKHGKLSDEEFRMVQSHAALGARILEPIDAYAEIIPIVLQHHERFDGKGYPDGLSGEEIHLGARILAVADVFDALTSDRPYRDGMPAEHVSAVILRQAGRQFDPMVVEAFLTIIAAKDVKAA